MHAERCLPQLPLCRHIFQPGGASRSVRPLLGHQDPPFLLRRLRRVLATHATFLSCAKTCSAGMNFSVGRSREIQTVTPHTHQNEAFADRFRDSFAAHRSKVPALRLQPTGLSVAAEASPSPRCGPPAHAVTGRGGGGQSAVAAPSAPEPHCGRPPPLPTVQVWPKGWDGGAPCL